MHAGIKSTKIIEALNQISELQLLVYHLQSRARSAAYEEENYSSNCNDLDRLQTFLDTTSIFYRLGDYKCAADVSRTALDTVQRD